MPGYLTEAMPLILVTPLSAVPEALRRYQPSHLISLLSPAYMIETPEGFPAARHLRLAVNDVSDPSLAEHPPREEHVSALLAFARAWDGRAPMLVHCWAGISRSMAAAFAILCDRAPQGGETAIACEIRNRAPHASPNSLIVRLADAQLGRKGKMIEAREAMGPGEIAEEGTPVEFPLAAFGL
jgi:predicted protein tyrosine phosphatase